MPEMRYRKPSARTLLGLTRLKKRAKKALGINKLLWPFRAVGNYKRRMLRRAGYYSPEMKMLRAARRGQVPGPLGPLQVGEGEHGKHSADGSSLLMAAALNQQQKHGKGEQPREGEGSGLAGALLMAAALHGAQSDEEPAHKAAHAHAEHAHKAAHAGEAKADPAHAHHQAPAKPAHHRGLRLLGLLLALLVVAAVVLLIWYFWPA